VPSGVLNPRWIAYCAFVALSLGLFNISPLVAQTTTYCFTGAPFNQCDGTSGTVPCRNGSSLTGSFTIAQPLPPNLVSTHGIGGSGDFLPEFFSFTDGITSVSNDSLQFVLGSTAGFAIETDAQGNLAQWSMYTSQNTQYFIYYAGPGSATQEGVNASGYQNYFNSSTDPGGSWSKFNGIGCSVPVSSTPLVSIAVSAAYKNTVAKGFTQQYKAIGTYGDRSTQDITNSVTWTSSNTSVATITTNGIASGVAVGGPVTISATSGSVSGTAPLTVTSATLSSIGIEGPAIGTVVPGQTLAFYAYGIFSDGTAPIFTNNTVTWASSNPSVATVGPTGLATGVAVGGPVSISATYGNFIATASMAVNGAGQLGPYKGNIRTVVGNGVQGYSGDGGPSVAARLSFAWGGALDHFSNGYIADTQNARIREVNNSSLQIETIAGGGSGCANQSDSYGDACLAAESSFVSPVSVFVDTANNLYISDSGASLIRQVSASTGIISAVAGGGAGCPGQINAIGDGCPASSAILLNPYGLYVDQSGNIFFADNGHQVIREVVASTGLIQTVAGTGIAGYNGDNIPATQAEVNSPFGVYGDAAGNIFIADEANSRIREITASSGTIVTVAGTGTHGYNGDNIPATTAQIFFPFGIYVDHSGNIFFSDSVGNGRIRQVVASTGLIQTVAGNGQGGFSGDGGPATNAEIGLAIGLAGDANGDLFIMDAGNNVIRQVFRAAAPFPISVSTTSLPGGTAGVPYSSKLQAIGGTMPFSWTLASGSLPPGFSELSSNGVLSGNPTTAGTYNFTVKVTDANSNSATQLLSLAISPAPTLVSITVAPVNPSIVAETTQQFTATGHYSDTSTKDLTNSVTWISSTTFVTISSSGLASGLATGKATITATLGNASGNTKLTVTSAPSSVPLTVTLIGTGNGTVTDNLEQISCTTTAGVQSGTCSANYGSGTVVTLTATPSSPSTFAGWGNACSGTQGCSVTMTFARTVTASFVPPPQMISLSFTPGTNVPGMATYDCPSNPSPSPGNPCTDPNAHAAAVLIPQVLQPFSLTVQASEVPPSVADGVCPSGATPSTDFDCRFVSFLTYQTLANGNKIVPLCFPYANGNCVHYQVFSGTPGVEPSPSLYVGPIDWTISFNNDTFVPPAPFTGSTPQMYDDPDYAVSPTSPFGTNCSTPMLVGNPPLATNPPIFCQFEFDITTAVDLTKKVDTAISGRTRQFNDVVIAFPPANTGNLAITTTPSPISGIVTAGSALNLTIAVTNSAGGPITGATLSDPLPAGTSVSWTISPPYTGPGTCAITGAVGSQVLNCAFGTIAASQTFSISLVSSNSSLGRYTNTAVVLIGNQQILTIGSIIVTIPGDVNGDGVVNCMDLHIIKASFGKKTGQAGFDPRADINHDGIVNVLDLATVARQLPTGTVCQ
jgi:uncharacterized repeat protein (TIGR01451 family)